MNSLEDALKFIEPDETALAFLDRAMKPALVTKIPFLDAEGGARALRGGEILEIVGPSASGKTELALEIAAQCVLPRERRGVKYDGSSARVVVIDCDGKFDSLRFLRAVNGKIAKALRVVGENKRETLADEVYEESMSRFTLVRAHSSMDVLKTLTALDAAWRGCGGRGGARFRGGRDKAEIDDDHVMDDDREENVADHGDGQRLVICDNVAAFYWLDRASRKDHGAPLNIQRIFASEARLFTRLARAHRVAIVVTKTTVGEFHHGEYRDFLPMEWTVAVTQRILLEPARDVGATYGEYSGVARWDTPRRPGGTFTVSALGMRC